MPRTLPWLQNENGKSSTARSARGRSSKSRISNVAASSSRRDREQTTKSARTPSTSPPPAPPDVEYMQDGDDQWMMVEDELLATAQTFTQHLHHAEYQRIKNQIKQRTNATLESIDRPTKGRFDVDVATARALQVKKKREAIERSTNAALDESGAAPVAREDSSDEADQLGIHDRNLAGLMDATESSQARFEVSSAPGAMSKSNTRAAAGMGSNVLRKPHQQAGQSHSGEPKTALPARISHVPDARDHESGITARQEHKKRARPLESGVVTEEHQQGFAKAVKGPPKLRLGSNGDSPTFVPPMREEPEKVSKKPNALMRRLEAKRRKADSGAMQVGAAEVANNRLASEVPVWIP